MKVSTSGSIVIFTAVCAWSTGAAAQNATQQTAVDGATTIGVPGLGGGL